MIENADNRTDVRGAPRRRAAAGRHLLAVRRGPGMEGAVDTLLIDEAGQVSLADALAVGTSARNLVLLGDPQQLAQVAQGGHPEETGGLGARAPARRGADDARRPRAVHRRQPAHAPRRLPVRQRDQLRAASCTACPSARTSGSTSERAVRRRPARLPGRARRQPPRLARGGGRDRRSRSQLLAGGTVTRADGSRRADRATPA